MSARAYCTGCGWVGKPTTPAHAAHAGRRHVCAAHEKRKANARNAAARRASSGTVRDCQHPRTHHEHGTRNAYVCDRCRCRPCRDAAAAYSRALTRDRLYGRPATLVDAGPVREHIAVLRAAGMGGKRIMALSGMSSGTWTKLVYGNDGRPPCRRCRPATAARILALTPDPVTVPADRTWRLIHGLIAHGYPKAWIARQLGSNTPALQLSGSRVRKAHALAVERLVDNYCDRPGPSDRARAYAAQRGWTVDLLWDDDDADAAVGVDEVLLERLLFGEAANVPRSDRLLYATALLDAGRSVTQVAGLLRISGGTLRALLDGVSDADERRVS